MRANTDPNKGRAESDLDTGRRKRVLIGVGDSSPAHRAVRVGGDLASALLADVMLLHAVAPALAVAETPQLQEALDGIRREEGARVLDHARRALPGTLRVEQALVFGAPADQIVDHARRWHADIIVLGTRRRGRLSQFLLGSTAKEVIRRAHCPVLTMGNGHDGGGDNPDDHDEPPTSERRPPLGLMLFGVG